MTVPSAPGTGEGAVNLLNCDREPVHIPGCIQPFGAVLVARKSDLQVVQVSTNLHEWLGKPPGAVLGGGLAAALGQVPADELARQLAADRLTRNPTPLFTAAPAGAGPVVVSAHALGESVLLELEPDDGSAPSGYASLNHTVRQLQGVCGLLDYCDRLAAEVRKLTGFDRVMVYRFHPDHSGEVLAEAAREGLPRYLGLRYPAADIPAPAREMYRRVWVRALPDITRASIPMVASVPTAPPADLTYCYLRGVSPIHVEYLTNMGVTASMSLSLLRDGELWGLIACHHYSPRRLPGWVRASCEVLAQVASLQLGAAEARDDSGYREAARSAHDAMIARAAGDRVPLATLVDADPGLLALVPCGGVALRFQGNWTTRGAVPPVGALEDFSRWLPAAGDEVVAIEHLASAYPPAGEWFSVAAGVLAARLSPTRQDVLLWFRPETVRTVRWAGDPNDKPVSYGPHGPRLHPRKSFEVWQQSVRGRSAPWTPAEIEAARRLRLAVLEVVVAHGERLARLNQQLADSNDELDSFAYVASHDLKEPLRGIFNHAQALADAPEMALEARRPRAESVLRLTRRMETMLESLLHYSRVGRLDLAVRDVDLNEVLAEVLDMLSARISEAGTEMRVPHPLPTVRCDHVRVRELLLNLVSNSVKYNDKPQRWVEIGFVPPNPNGSRPLQFYVKDNGIGIRSKFFDQVFTIFKRLHGRDEYGGGSGAGLTIARRIVERHGGCIWIESEPGEGSTFFFTLSAEDAHS